MIAPRPYVFLGLNAARILSLIALILVFCSSIVVMVHDVEAVNQFLSTSSSPGNSTDSSMEDCDYIENSTVPNQPAGAFWAVLNRLLIIFQVVMLILSEIGWPASFFDRFFPVLGEDFGLGPLGVFQGLIGATILSHHVDTFTLVSAFLLFSVGCLNIVLGLIFRGSAKTRRSITSWRAESKGVLPPYNDKRPLFARPSAAYVPNVFGQDSKKTVDQFGSLSSGKAGYGFGRQGEKAAAEKGYMISRPLESTARYAPKPNPPTPRSSVPVFHSSPTAL